VRLTLLRLISLSTAAMIAAACAAAPDFHPGPAASLGRICANDSGCPSGHLCAHLDELGFPAQGFCTIPCRYDGDTATCTEGFSGPGHPRCALPIPGGIACVIRCNMPGAAEECPDALTCTPAPEGDGVCIPPA
jgi:hypothetical protein